MEDFEIFNARVDFVIHPNTRVKGLDLRRALGRALTEAVATARQATSNELARFAHSRLHIAPGRFIDPLWICPVSITSLIGTRHRQFKESLPILEFVDALYEVLSRRIVVGGVGVNLDFYRLQGARRLHTVPFEIRERLDSYRDNPSHSVELSVAIR